MLWTYFGVFFWKIFLPSVRWRVEASKCFQKIKKVSNFQECPKSFPKCPNMLWTSFGVIFSKKIFCPVFHGGSSLRNVFKKIKKFSKIQKCPKSFPKCPNVFWTCFGVIFPKIFFAQCSMEGRVFETFSKNQKIFKIPKMPKIVPKNVQRSFEHVLGLFFRNIFLPSVPWRFESSKCFQRSKIFQNSKNNRKCSPKVSERVLNTFWGNFSENFFAQCSMEGRVFEMFSKNRKNFKISKNAQNRSQNVQTCYEQVLG